MTADLLASAVWECANVDPGAIDSPVGLRADEAIEWIPAIVPGTAAAAVRQADGAEAARAIDFDAWDWWFRAVVDIERKGVGLLRWDGLATLADVWWDGTPVAQSDAMFTPGATTVPLAPGPREIAIRFRSLDPVLSGKFPRPRWRSRLVGTQSLRWIRTTLLGRMPALAPSFAPVGPWRPLTLVADTDAPPSVLDLEVSIDGNDGHVCVHLASAPPGALLRVAGVDAQFTAGSDGARATAAVPNVERWWPHTHGPQPLYDVAVVDGDRVDVVARIGFRELRVDRSDGGFALIVNDIPVFARGACWVPTDPIGLLDDASAVRAQLLTLRSAGMNMVRVTGTNVYESSSFWDACDELGFLVWQDAMLATLDPPEDEEWLQSLATEVTAVLEPLRGRPSLAVVSGGSETEQQPTMLGLPADRRTMTALSTTLPAVVDKTVPGTPFVSATPSGGDLPTHNGAGLAHYFGVGGYRRPLSDVRRTGVRFAAECLAFAIPPERPSVRELFGTDTPQSSPEWIAGIPADHGVDWTFQDVTDHYVRELLAADVVADADPAMRLDLQRAVVAHLMVETFTEWRRPGSRCGGALVLTARDLEPGPGWGLTDVLGHPKAPLVALRTVLAPQAVLVTDEGLDGLVLHLVNDTASAVTGIVDVTLVGTTGGREHASAEVIVPARGGVSRSVDGILGAFRDVTNAYGFGPPQYAGVLATWRDASGDTVAQRYRAVGPWPIGDPGLSATLAPRDSAWTLTINADRAAAGVVIEAPGWLASDGWFGIEPGGSRLVTLDGGLPGHAPVGTVRALGGPEVPLTA